MIAEPAIPSKQYAYRLMLAIEAECVTYRHYIPWADRLIMRLAKPPLWICELSTKRYRPDALRSISDYLFSEPFEDFTNRRSEFFGYLWLKYERREISWATFLSEAGQHADGSSGPWACEYFYELLNHMEEQDFSIELEQRQCAEVQETIAIVIDAARELYKQIRTNS